MHCIDFCILINRTDLLFEYIYDRFSENDAAKAVFLECLEPYILNDSLKIMSPAVLKDFVSHYERCGALAVIEACITHVDIAAIDIHQVCLFISLYTINAYDELTLTLLIYYIERCKSVVIEILVFTIVNYIVVA